MNSSSIELGPVGIWTAQLDYQPAAKAKEVAAELERLGFGAIWFPESTGREALTNASLLLGATNRIVIATGIANIIRPRLMGIIKWYPLEENESGQIKESNYATHATL